jgi:hypothetical protein
MTDLQRAAHAVLDRWHSPQWDEAKQGSTSDLMAELQRALAAETLAQTIEREAMRQALALIEVGETKKRWSGYADNVDAARDILRAALKGK